MALGADDCQTSGGFHLLGQLDVGASTRHVSGDGDSAGFTSEGHNLSLLLVELGVEHLTGNMAHIKHALEQLGDLHGGCAYEYGATLLTQSYNLLNYCSIFLFLGLIDAVVHILTCNRAIGGYGHNVEFVDIPELSGLGFCRTGHTGELVIHTEIVLKGDGGECLGGGLYGHALLCLDGLMQPVAVAASLHYTSGLLVNNLNLVVVNHIFHILLKEGVGFEQLSYSVNALGFHGIILHQLILFGLTLGNIGDVFSLRELGCYVGEYEELRVRACAGEHVDTLVGEFHAAVLFVNHKVEWLGSLRHLA